MNNRPETRDQRPERARRFLFSPLFAASILLVLASPLAAQGGGGAGGRGAGSGGAARGGAAAARDTTPNWSSAASDARTHVVLDSLRRGILRLASFAGFGDEPCAVGDLRTFDRDTANDSRRMLGEFEQLVASYGAFESLDNPTGRALLRAVMRLETGGPGPRWDVLTGDAPRAFNPVLPTRLYDVNKKQCVPMMGTVPDGVVLPLVTNFTPPRDSGAVQVDVGYGAEGMNSLRNLFFARHQNDTTAVLHDARVTAHAIWQDYALVSVLREAEARGVIPIEGKMTGAVYAFHRVDGEWRLLAFAKNW